jgi:dipeptidyl aminopeptidase/acylaminoacyl peptidase
MKGPGFIGVVPQNPHWSADGSQIYFQKQHPDSLAPNYFSFALNSGQTKVLDEAQWAARWSKSNDFSTHNALLKIKENQIEILDLKTKQISTFNYFGHAFWNPQNLKQGNEVVLQQQFNLFQLNLQTGLLTHLITYQKGEAPKAKDSPLTAAELEFFESERRKQLQNTKIEINPKLQWLDFEPNGALQVDPSARFVILREESEPQSKGTEVPHFIASDAHVYTEKSRSKVHNEEPHTHIFIHDLQSVKVQEVSFANLPNMGENRKLFVHPVIFADHSQTALCDVRSSDNKDRWIVQINLTNAAVELIDHQHDVAWIGGPGISSWNMETGTLGWLVDSKTVYFQSEQTGFSHLYTYDLQSKHKMALTSGNYEVHGVELSEDQSSFYLHTNKQHPGTRSFSKLDLKTLKMTDLLQEPGAYEVLLSPDETQMLYRFSTSTQPWELFVAAQKNPTKKLQITHSTTSIYDAAAKAFHSPQVLSFKASDGVQVYARLYEPTANVKNGAAVLFVHGAGYLQNAHQYWSYYEREFLFHQLLAQKGYTVLDVDYRASEGYGRDYRTAIYRHMGGRDLQDYVDAKQFLVSTYGIDSARVGIYGGSYGGFITLMGLFTKPNTFACGAALRSVSDWAHYNHEYTTNILNTPAADPEAYKQSSPIYFAEGLQDPLLILHGMIDDNVQFQDVVRLNQRLIELGKKDYWMALYPVERHSFKYTSSWVDEYRRILELFETYLK